MQQRLVKTGGRLVKHARYHWLMLAESHLTERLFGAMVGRDRSLAGRDRVAGRADGTSEIRRSGGQGLVR